MKHFEKELLKHFRSRKDDLSLFVLNNWKENHSRRSFNQYFQEVVLFKTGAISVNTTPHLNKYIPSITFNKENIYGQINETKYLSKKPLSERQAELKIVDYIIKYCLYSLSAEKLKEIL